jgi:hypothetical protein
MRWLELPSGVVVDGGEVWRRDAYGFAVRPQHLQRFREYAKIYKVIYQGQSRNGNALFLFVSG